MTELSGEPAYQQVANDLRRQIRKGSMPAGTRLPSTSQLMATYGHSSTVIKAAINELRADGLVVGQQGKGVFVRDPSGTEERTEGSDQFRVLMAQVRTLRDEVRQVNKRLAVVEQHVLTTRRRSGL